MPDWLRWHDAYDDPDSALSRRREVVVRYIVRALDTAPRARPTLLSLCAGDGRDVLSALAVGQRDPARVVLVESDPTLSARARRASAGAGLPVEVREADAGLRSSYADVLPVDILVVCGVLGNVAHGEVEALVGLVPGLVARGGHVVWTRGGSEPDRRPELRRWFAEAGMEELAFGGAPAPYGVGVHRVDRPSREVMPDRLFAFVDR